ncbi:hypothetical protein VB834_25180 [Limnoraphis robusta Tam1]|uniref:hypothetical protein n=1 Tax=Limnoraphis robusta TaxID=1118279 RepID=UPI002B221381|nr:hypothetical protein [Limnoraphis robusta]MEA5498169.1 hypothetical protein [Limnoraphis robusta BA-68 BA1]MEA5542328.1 hypothetical protein [Limnoraphis robusta Tam1]
MRPKIKDQVAWQQAELLMQPILIRLLDNIRKKLEEPSVWKGTYHNTETPYPGYRLDLECNNQKVSLDIWELCYQVCFKNYQLTHAPQESQEVEIDTSLIDHTGDVDWTRIDEKARMIIDQFFDNSSNEVGQS